MNKKIKMKNASDRKKTILIAGGKALSLAESILVEIMEQWEDSIFSYHHHWAGFGQSVRASRREYEERASWREKAIKRQALGRLKASKFIEHRRKGGRMIWALTESGKIRAAEAALRSSRQSFDDRICLVSFDFPEAARAARGHFRHFLKRIGFVFVHGSMWSCRRDVSGPLLDIVRLLGAGKWVKVYVVFEKG